MTIKRRNRGEDIGRMARPNHLVADVDEELDFHLEGRRGVDRRRLVAPRRAQ